MTIKTRNYFFLALVIVFSMCLLAASAMLGYSIHSGTLTRPDVFPVERIAGFYMKGYSFIATIAAIFIFALYALFAVVYLHIEFEKTQSTEVIFFALFLIGCFAETVRLCVPLFNLWHELSAFLLFTGRTVLFARTLAPTALLFDAIFSGTEARQHVERNLVILIMVSVMISMLMPLNTAIVLPNFCIKLGSGKAFITVRALILAAAILSLFVNARSERKTHPRSVLRLRHSDTRFPVMRHHTRRQRPEEYCFLRERRSISKLCTENICGSKIGCPENRPLSL